MRGVVFKVGGSRSIMSLLGVWVVEIEEVVVVLGLLNFLFDFSMGFEALLLLLLLLIDVVELSTSVLSNDEGGAKGTLPIG